MLIMIGVCSAFTIMEKQSAPFLERVQLKTLFRSEVTPILKNNQCSTASCALINHFYSFIQKRSITSDRNDV